MRELLRRSFVAALVVACFGLVASTASAAEATYILDHKLSLTGDCGESGLDPVKDPSCPYSPPPAGPSGRFDEPRSIAVDNFGNEYVASYAFDGDEGRIDVFNDEGKFITELLDPNGPKSIAVDSEGNLYVYEQILGTPARVVRFEPSEYKPAEDKIAYGNPGVVVSTPALPFNGGVTIDASNDHLFVAADSFIAEFTEADDGNKALPTITHPKLVSSTWVEVDAQRRRLYTSYCKDSIFECGVLVFQADAPHNLLEEIDGSDVPAGEFRSSKGWLSIAADEETGHFFVDDLENTDNIYEFDEDYEYVSTITLSSFQGGNALQIALSNAVGAFNRHYLFVPVLLRSGRALAFRPVQEFPPEVNDATATNIGETEAELRANINPGSLNTEYLIELEEEGSGAPQVVKEGTISGESQESSVNALLTGLSPGATYIFRISATNSKGSDEEESIFATYFDASPSGGPPCPNASLRTGFSSSLPDCRAYELVTPPNTNGRPPRGAGAGVNNHFSTLLSSPSGNAVSFLTEGGPLPGFEGTGGFNGDPYRATRGASGWTTAAVGPNGTETDIPLPASYSPDQGYMFWVASGEGTAVVGDGAASYVRYPDGHSALIGRGSLGSDPEAIGMLISEGGGHIIFRTRNFETFMAQQLEPNAPPTGTEAIYDRTSDEKTHVISLLPGDVTPEAGDHAVYRGASVDGEGVAFSIDNVLYLREDNSETYEIGENVTFAGISEDGERIFYLEGGDLFAFDTNSEEAIQFTETGTPGDAVVVNVATEGTHAYFVSTTAIAGSGENPNGAFPIPGQQNLYLSEEGTIRFVGTVTTRDVEGVSSGVGNTPLNGLGLWIDTFVVEGQGVDPSRSTPDGSVLLFQSQANLANYDSGDFAQIYRYDSVANRLHCVSCIPTKRPATGGASLQTIGEEQGSPFPLDRFGLVANLRFDGRRAFFQSMEALVAGDTNGKQDVYEWEDQGVGSCERPGGCVYLISSGSSGQDNYLYAVSRSGDDAFFVTDDILVPGDDNTLSIYDARVNGGFPPPVDKACEGEGCRPGLSPPPSLPSAAKPVTGADDQVPATRRCPRGKRKVKRGGKVRCVKKHQKQRQKKNGARRTTKSKKGAAR